MKISPFKNPEGQLRNGWWIALFFLIMAAMLFPLILISKRADSEVPIAAQACIVIVACWICQALRRRSIQEITGKLDIRWAGELALGMFGGALLMAAPALLLLAVGAAQFQYNGLAIDAVLGSLALMFAGAAAEEFLFRGFVFQRLIAGIREWPAQVVLAAYFLLTHWNNPGMEGEIRQLAGVNIFLASLMFGLAFVRTQSLALPLGLHFMANWVQGPLFGFGVSGTSQPGLLTPHFASDAPIWLTGGRFGLEASLPGLVCVVAALVLLYLWRPKASANS